MLLLRPMADSCDLVENELADISETGKERAKDSTREMVEGMDVDTIPLTSFAIMDNTSTVWELHAVDPQLDRLKLLLRENPYSPTSDHQVRLLGRYFG